MAKPLLTGGNGKSNDLVGTATGQTPVWSQTGQEWAPGTPASSGGGGVTYYLNENTAPESPTTNIPTGASGATVKELGTTADSASTTVASTASVPVLPTAPELIAGFVTDVGVPGLTGIPAGLWEFNVWAEANGNTTNQSYLQVSAYKYDGTNAPTLIASSEPAYLYDPADVTQYTLTVLIPGGTALLATDRIYVALLGGSTTSNRQITVHFGNGEPSHVHTSIIVPVNLGTDVTGTLPVANGGTGVTTTQANKVFAGPTTGADAAPSFRALVYADIGTLIPYDLPCEIPGVPSTSTKVVNFIAVRPYRLASSGHRGGCAEVDPSSNTSFTVYKNASSVGTITFNSDGTFSSSITQTDFAIDDILSVDTPAAVNSMDTPFWTLAMTLL